MTLSARSPDSPEQIFVIGTGRCGSTLVSSMLRQHPDIASISEFFSLVTDLGCCIDGAFPSDAVSGQEMWQILDGILPRQNLMLQHDVAMHEVLYPWRHPESDFQKRSGVSAICQVMLPHLLDANAVYPYAREPQTPQESAEQHAKHASLIAQINQYRDELAAFVTSLPAAPCGEQYQKIFAYIAAKQHSSIWAERSGGGLRVVKRLLEHFPKARFIHVVRDGRDTSISMSQHAGFRFVFAAFQMLELLGVDPFVSMDRRWEGDLTDELAALLPERFSKEAFIEFSTPPPLCGHYWSGEIAEGMRLIGDMPPERCLTVKYEDILSQPHDEATRMVRFMRQHQPQTWVDHVDDTWVQRAASLVRQPRSSWRDLPEKMRIQTQHACDEGLQALARAGVQYV